MEPILLLGGLAALLYWLTSSKSSSGGGGGSRAPTATTNNETVDNSIGVPAAVETTDDYQMGVQAGRMDAGDAMDAVVASGEDSGPATETRWDTSMSTNWQLGYLAGYDGMLTDHGWTYDKVNGVITMPPMSTSTSTDTTADSNVAYNNGYQAGVDDAKYSISQAQTPPYSDKAMGDASHSRYNSFYSSFASKGLGSFFIDGYNHGFDKTLYDNGFRSDAPGINASQIQQY